MSSDPNYSANIEGTFGALFWGTVAATGLWGVTAVQTYFYFDHYKRDALGLKILVGLVFLSDTIHQCLILHAIHYYLISSWGNLNGLLRVTQPLYQDVSLNGFTGFLVQSFFVYRIWTLTRNYWVVIGLYIMVIINFVFALVYVGLGANLPTFVALFKIKPVSLAINAATAVSDVCITVTICSYLKGSKTGWSTSTRLVDRLITFSISTGLITSLCACLSLIFYLALPETLIYFGLYLTIGRLYSNSLLVTLNARKSIRLLGDPNAAETHTMSTRNAARRAAGLSSMSNSQKVPTAVQVQIETVRDYSSAGVSRTEKSMDRSRGRIIDDRHSISAGEVKVTFRRGSEV